MSTPALQKNLFINGAYSPSSTGETLTIHNPADDSLVSDNVQVASEADVDRAVAAARAAFPTWRELAGHRRAACMLRFADLLERESGRLAELGEISCFLSCPGSLVLVYLSCFPWNVFTFACSALSLLSR